MRPAPTNSSSTPDVPSSLSSVSPDVYAFPSAEYAPFPASYALPSLPGSSSHQQTQLQQTQQSHLKQNQTQNQPHSPHSPPPTRPPSQQQQHETPTPLMHMFKRLLSVGVGGHRAAAISSRALLLRAGTSGGKKGNEKENKRGSGVAPCEEGHDFVSDFGASEATPARSGCSGPGMGTAAGTAAGGAGIRSSIPSTRFNATRMVMEMLCDLYLPKSTGVSMVTTC